MLLFYVLLTRARAATSNRGDLVSGASYCMCPSTSNCPRGFDLNWDRLPRDKWSRLANVVISLHAYAVDTGATSRLLMGAPKSVRVPVRSRFVVNILGRGEGGQS